MISKTVNLIMTSLQIIIHKQPPVSINAPKMTQARLAVKNELHYKILVQ